MSMDYVRARYGLPWLRRGLRVLVPCPWEPDRLIEATVTRAASGYVWVRWPGLRRSRACHPLDVLRVEERGTVIPLRGGEEG